MSNETISAPRDWVQHYADLLEECCAYEKSEQVSALLAQPAAQHQGEPVAWWNGCNESVPAALRYLANHPRPAGGEQRYNAEHLYQLAGEIERMAETPLYTRPAEQPTLAADQWPKLEKPAKVGAGRFSAGISTRLVVEAAQRHYEYEVTPEKETLRIAQGATSLAQCWRQAVLPPSAAVLCLMAIAAKNACGEDAAGIPLFVFAAAIKAALAERHSDHARALEAATSLDDGGPYVSDT